MILKNEEEYLPQCLESVRDIVDDIVVVDTGSTDNTMEIASSFGARIYNLKWRSNFAEARNFSLSKAYGEWILVLDADETIDESDHGKLLALTNDPKFCFLLTQRHYMNDFRRTGFYHNEGRYPKWEKNYQGYIESSLVRLFPNRADITYEKRVHELVEYRLARERKYSMVKAGIPIHHYGNSDELVAKRAKRSLYSRLGEKKLKENDGDTKACFELGIELLNGGRAAEAVTHLEMVTKKRPNYAPAFLNLSSALCLSGRLEDALKVLIQSMELVPESPEFFCNLGVAFDRLKQDDMALHCYCRALGLNPTYINAMNNLAMHYSRRSKFAEAALCFERVLQLLPNEPNFHKLLADTLIALGKPAEAIPHYEKFALLNGESSSMPEANTTQLPRGSDIA